MVTCPLVPDVPHLTLGSCSSPRTFGLDFLQTSSRDDALALLLAFGSAYTWHEDFHLASSVPCPAHTASTSGGALFAPSEPRSGELGAVVMCLCTQTPIDQQQRPSDDLLIWYYLRLSSIANLAEMTEIDSW